MNLATKDIRHNLGRFALTAVGIGMLLMVVMGMAGIYRGVVEDATLLIDRVGADLWIVQRDTRGRFAELSRVPSNLVYRAAAVRGVQSSRDFAYHTVQRQRNGKPLRIAVLGLSWPTDKGERVPLTAGRPLRQSHYEMIADKTLGFRVGEPLKLGKETYRVAGTTSNMISSGGDGIAFFTVADAQAIQFDIPGEAVRLERAARESRGEDFELAVQQPMMLDHAWRPTVQLPAVARAIANRPSVILADEPTAALDGHRGRQVMELCAKVAHEQGAGVIVVTHDHRALDVFDTIYEMKDGLMHRQSHGDR